MAQGRKADDEVKARVLALVAAGNSIPEAAAACELSHVTVYRWMDQDPACKALVQAAQRPPPALEERIDDILEWVKRHVVTNLTAVQHRARITSSYEYVMSQPADGIAKLQDVDGRHGYRGLAMLMQYVDREDMAGQIDPHETPPSDPSK